MRLFSNSNNRDRKRRNSARRLSSNWSTKLFSNINSNSGRKRRNSVRLFSSNNRDRKRRNSARRLSNNSSAKLNSNSNSGGRKRRNNGRRFSNSKNNGRKRRNSVRLFSNNESNVRLRRSSNGRPRNSNSSARPQRLSSNTRPLRRSSNTRPLRKRKRRSSVPPHLRTQPIEAATHIDRAGRGPYPGCGAEVDQLREFLRMALGSSVSMPRPALILSLDSPIEMAAGDAKTASPKSPTR